MNRLFQQSVAADQGLYGPPMPPAQLRGQPWMQQGPPMPPMQMEMGGMCDELAMIDQDLNMTRRATRAFVPQQSAGMPPKRRKQHQHPQRRSRGRLGSPTRSPSDPTSSARA